MSIRVKIMTGFAFMATIGIILGITGLISIRILVTMNEELHDREITAVGLNHVLTTHFIWRHELTEAVMSDRNFQGSLNPESCSFGEWLTSYNSDMLDDPEFLHLLSKIKEPHKQIHYEAANIVRLMESGDPEGAAKLLLDIVYPASHEVISTLGNMEKRLADLNEAFYEEIDQLGNRFIILIIALVIFTLITGTIISVLISGKITKPILPLTSFLRRAADTGDITIHAVDKTVIDVYSTHKDEIGRCIKSAAAFVQHVTEVSDKLEEISNGNLDLEHTLLSEKDIMGASLVKMIDKLNLLFNEVRNSTTLVANESKQVAEGAQALAQGSTQQAAAVEELSASISEIAHTTKDNAGLAENAAVLAGTILGNAEQGSLKMDEMMNAVKEINQASTSISKVIKAIDDIAFQTNSLALNAAVEAARAGQHGKGFAVVADEVRKLAAKSADAARENNVLIQNSIEKAELGSQIALETSTSLTEIVTGINESNSIINEIAKYSEEQSYSINQVNEGIEQVAQVIQQITATAEESAAASDEMSRQSASLSKLVSQFKVK
jgi:methyl-accepting chemotaxis protein